MGLLIEGALIGVLATVAVDLWAAFVKKVLGLPTANWALVGRWFGHMRHGVFAHDSVANAEPVPNELALGWAMHYLIGMAYGVAYLVIVRALFAGPPTLLSALVFGLVTLVAPWLLMQPGMGAGVFASRTPRPGMTRAVNLSMHAVFGASLYLAWLLLGAVIPPAAAASDTQSCTVPGEADIAGVWRLVQASTTLPDGTVEYPYGNPAAGLFVYTPGGHLSLHLHGNPPPPAFDKQPDDAELGAVARSYIGYYGRWTLDDGRLTHRIEGAMYPNQVGQAAERPVSLCDGKLELTFTADDGRRYFRQLERIEEFVL
jgi:Protein of unknown function (DUF2938)/Lipocalin-like domain